MAAEPQIDMTSAAVKLPAEINSATRSLHTHLNALITSRLPLALPPHSSTPDVYLTGLIPFASIYLAFEKAWEQACSRHVSPSSTLQGDELWVDVPLDASIIDTPNSQDTAATQLLGASQIAPPPEIAVLTLLRSLRPHGLARADRLRRDIAALAGIPFDDVDTFLAEHTSDSTSLFVTHIEETVAGKPHVLLAYAFVLYMAIFSGGRWIRSVLASTGSSFWAVDETSAAPVSPQLAALLSASSVHERLRTFTLEQQAGFENVGLSFWFWSGFQDGTDIKAEFKRRLDGVEDLLTENMRTDVIAEAKQIFVRCGGLVGELDESVGRQGKVVLSAKNRDLQTEADDNDNSSLAASIIRHAQDVDWIAGPRLAGFAVVLSCVSWYAMYQAGMWSI